MSRIPDNPRRNTSPSPIYGCPPGFNIADLPASYASGVAALTAVTTDTTSAAIALGARTIEIAAEFSDAVTTCDLLFYTSSGGDVLVYTITGASLAGGDTLFAGGFEGVNFNGLPIKVRATNFAGGGSVSVTIKRTS